MSINAKEIQDNIFLIKVPLPNSPLKNLNSYLLRNGERNLLIDTGFNMDECYNVLKSNLDYLGVDMADTDIFFTHLHADHSGLLARISHENSRAYMGSPDVKKTIYNREQSKKRWRDQELQFYEAGYTREELLETRSTNPGVKYISSTYTKLTPVDDGHEFVDYPGFAIKTVHTPGHTPGHMCLYETNKNILFAGDHILFDITSNISDWPELDDTLGTYLQSLERIRQMDVNRVYAGHRENEIDHIARIDELIWHHEKRLNEVESIVNSSPGLTAYDITGKMKWKIRAKGWDDFPLGQKVFAVGEAMAHIHYLVLRKKVFSSFVDGRYYFYPTEEQASE